MDDHSISLNKYISSTGICSRREADRWIDAGRVKINGKVAKKGNRVQPSDEVLVDDSPLKKPKHKKIYLAVHKAPGITSTTDLSDPTNIIDFVNYPKRIFPIGRLDKGSSGLILMTNDGDIVNKILRSENNHEKEYIVKVDKPITQSFLNRMAKGVHILGTVTKPCQVQELKPNLFRIILTQGMNRQIRRMCEHLGYNVLTLKRVRIMNITLDNLPLATYRELTAAEIQGLKKQLH